MKNNVIIHAFQSFLIFLCFISLQSMKAENYDLLSPNGALKIKIDVTEQVRYEVFYNDIALLTPSVVSMSFNNDIEAGVNGTVKSTGEKSIRETIPVLIGKNATLDDHYNELRIDFTQQYALVFRAYDDGVAYRFETSFADNTIVNSEQAVFSFANNPAIHYPTMELDRYDHWERSYDFYNSISEITDNKSFAVTPVLVSYTGTPYKVVLMEAGLLDYPAMYMFKNDNYSLRGKWAQYPDQVKEPDNIYSQHEPLTRFDYLAKVEGTRTYPWRVIAVSNDDKSLLNNEIVYKLAEPQRLTDVSWIKPGKTTWEWGHKAILEGVGFPSGGGTVNLNLQLYKYYVDFAARNNIEYLTLDAGWSDSYIRQLCAYAKGQGVKILVWTWTSCAVDQPGWMQKMKNYGISGFKIDFVNRSDQPATNWLETLAKRAADLEMVVMFHGCPVPTGLNRTYPNILNFEAVRGLENNYWDRSANPDYNMLILFSRMLAGAFDYTPGSFQNTTKGQFRPIDSGTTVPGTNPSAMGTRCHHLAMYVMYDQPLAYMVDSPTEYEKYPDIMTYFQKVPTVWKKTVPLDAKVGEYAMIAKQTDKDDWFVAGMSNWTRRNVTVDFSFLPEGISYEATIYRDSTTSNGYPQRYVCEKKLVSRSTLMPIFMADGGGFSMMLTPYLDSGIKNENVKSLTIAYVDVDKMLNIHSNEMIQGVKIYNITGQLVLNKSFSDGNLQKINISDLNKGSYVLEVKAGTCVDILKFIY